MKEAWSQERIVAAIAFIQSRLDSDFAASDLPGIELKVDPAWTGSVPTSAPRPDDVIVVCGGHEFLLGLQHGVEFACAAAANALQDDVMGEQNRPWPELLDTDGRYAGVLTPSTEDRNIAHWRLNDAPFCAVGHLHEAVRAAGLTISGQAGANP